MRAYNTKLCVFASCHIWHNIKWRYVNRIASRPSRGKVVIHFDGVRVEFGPHQGGGKHEHICINSTGVGGERKVAIVVAQDGTGVIIGISLRPRAIRIRPWV